MLAVLAALSLTDQAQKYGAYAGIAAIVGLGVLVLLYISQAREVKRLREWAGRAPERDAELQQRVVVEAQRRASAPRPVVAPQAAQRPAAPTQPVARPVASPDATQALPTTAAPGVADIAAQPARPLAPGPGTPAAAQAAAAAAHEQVVGAGPQPAT
ncbi:MAG: hypothetical protein LT070_00540, partial [Solirubrobacteraceae bacterium]|nr:hypothetical protein [Solirubrobacteraceae bacterium]